MGKPETVYVTYVAATPENVWEALTGVETSRQYFFGGQIESAWKLGFAWTLGTGGRVDRRGEVLEFDPPRRLSINWRAETCEETRHLPDSIVTLSN